MCEDGSRTPIWRLVRPASPSTGGYTGSAMLPNAFIGKPEKPTDAELADVLGPAKRLWDQLLADLADEFNLATGEWGCSSRKTGWSLRLKRQDRNIVYLSPSQGCFTASYALGAAAVQAVLRSGLSQPVIRLIQSAKRYAEGTAVRIEVRARRDIAVVRKLTAAKLAR